VLQRLNGLKMTRKNIIPKEEMSPYQRWELASFDEVPEPEIEEEELLEEPPPPALTAEELDAIREHAREDGYAEGHQQGYQAGRSEGYMGGLQQGQQEINEIIQYLRQVAMSFGTEVSQCSESMAPELLNLGLDISKAMLKTVVAVKPELILPTITNAIHALPCLQLPALLYLNPADATLVREHLGEELTQNGWRLIDDPHLDRGGCRVETGTNQIDATMQTRWRRIAESLSKQLDWLE
jgi:flagellar assembly protein FliH